MADLKLKVNQSVELNVESGVYEGEYISQVTKIDDDEIQITLPIKKENLVPLPVGTELEIFFSDQRAQYKFKAKINSRQRNNKIGTFSVEKPNKLYKIQRRDFVRVPIKITVEYRKLVGEDIINSKGNSKRVKYNEDKQEEFKETLSEDISGGGMLLRVNEEIPLNSLIELRLDLDDLDFKTIIGKVVRVDEFVDRNDKVGSGIKFINISQKRQDEIVQWVLQKQLELHRKGLL
ncbi:flagellar brake protein [Selenihalanaerobacter shriftii]|uniref:C-di-GMP-binding flagellar brake protein YcgR, contains PilZNR and PilZ domains n=1 Tax=Selenihalanaerobacter shriftii TaxID=142842 RepID=A0A1T4MCX0_9FIRM|nr:flagellar brake domain-containing protein [Selenihalanaerobacter shriftii]SJZ64584.1 c-di-GMP-binding flagellar brake protein YcgR, contains PilZNR and PilZ domains [Selenihalanaerobacter shriftii]